MKTFQSFLIRLLLINPSLALSLRFIRRTTARMRLGLAILTFGACLVSQTEAQFEINVLNSQYTTYIFGRTNSGPITGTYSAVGDIVIYPENGISRATVSPTPFSDSIYVDSTGSLVAQTSATTFGVYTYTDSPQLITLSGYWNNIASAGAESEISFSPLMSGTATIGLQFDGYGNWYNSQGFVSLFDVTANQTLWSNVWYLGHFATPETVNEPVEGGVGGNVPWTDTPYSETTTAAATLSLETDFNTADTYTLIMYSQTFSNNESEGTSIQLSGLDAVPEPCPFALLGLAATLLVSRRVPYWSQQPLRLPPSLPSSFHFDAASRYGATSEFWIER